MQSHHTHHHQHNHSQHHPQRHSNQGQQTQNPHHNQNIHQHPHQNQPHTTHHINQQQAHQTPNHHHHNINQHHQQHSHSHHHTHGAPQMGGGPQMPAATPNMGVVVTQGHNLAPQVHHQQQQQPQQTLQSQEGQQLGQQKQANNQQQPSTMHVSNSHHMQAIDHQHKSAPGVQHHTPNNTLIAHPQPQHPTNQAHSHHMTNLQQPNQLPHQSNQVVPVPAMQQSQQQQPNPHNTPHIQQQQNHHQTSSQYNTYMHQIPPFSLVQTSYQHNLQPFNFVLPNQVPSHQAGHNVINQQAGGHLGANNHLAQSPNLNVGTTFPGGASKYHPINTNYSPHQQTLVTPNASGPLHHQGQLHPTARSAQSKGPPQPQMQQQSHDPQSRQIPAMYPIPYPFPYNVPQHMHPHYMTMYGPPFTFAPTHTASPNVNVNSSEVDTHIPGGYPASQPGPHIPANHIPQPTIIQQQIAPIASQQSTTTPNYPIVGTPSQPAQPRPKKGISIVDPKTGRAKTHEELMSSSASKAGSTSSAAPTSVDTTADSSNLDARPSTTGTISKTAEQSQQACEIIDSTLQKAPDTDVKADLDVGEVQSKLITESTNPPKDADHPVKTQDQPDPVVSEMPEQSKIAQDFPRLVAQVAIGTKKGDGGKLQSEAACDLSSSSDSLSAEMEKMRLTERGDQETRIPADDDSSNKINEVDSAKSPATCDFKTEPTPAISEPLSVSSMRLIKADDDNSQTHDEFIEERRPDSDEPLDKMDNPPVLFDDKQAAPIVSIGSDNHQEGQNKNVSDDLSDICRSTVTSSSNKLSSESHSGTSTPTQSEEKEISQENSTPETKSSLTYDNEGQYSPFNSNGKKKYSRDFLKSVALSLGYDFLSMESRAQSVRTNEIRDNFAPGYVQQYHPANIAQRRPSQQVNNKPRRVIETHSLHQEVELKTTKNPWKPTLAKNENEMKAEEIDTERLIKLFRGHLNKLTPQKYDQLIEKIKALDLGTEDRMNKVIDLVFDKAVDEPSFCELYARMCQVLATKKTDDSKSIFCYALVKKCQREFENEDIYDGLNVEERQEVIENTTDGLKRKQLSDELYEDQRLRRRKYLGTIKLIGEMYKLNLLLPIIIGVCMKRLISTPTSENLECLCSLITTVGANLSDSSDDVKQGLNNTLTQLQNIANNKKTLQSLQLDVRIKFKIFDVIELSRRAWRPRNQENGPKMLDEIQREHTQETLLKNSSSYNLKNLPNKNDDRSRKIRPNEPITLMEKLSSGFSQRNSLPLFLQQRNSSPSEQQSLRPQSIHRPPKSDNDFSSPNQNSDLHRPAILNSSSYTSSPIPAPRSSQSLPITIQSNVNGSPSSNSTSTVTENICHMVSSDKTENQIADVIDKLLKDSAPPNHLFRQDMVIQIVKGCISSYGSQYRLDTQRLTKYNKTLLYLLEKEISNQSLISGINDLVEQMGYPTHLLGDIYQHMINECFIAETEFSIWFTEDRWTKARDSSPKFVRYLSESL